MEARGGSTRPCHVFEGRGGLRRHRCIIRAHINIEKLRAWGGKWQKPSSDKGTLLIPNLG